MLRKVYVTNINYRQKYIKLVKQQKALSYIKSKHTINLIYMKNL